MKIAVCVKFVPDTAIKIKLAADGRSVDVSDATHVVNPYDEFAVEESLQIRERRGGEVVVISAGGERAAAGLRSCLAMGADRAVLVAGGLLSSVDDFSRSASVTPLLMLPQAERDKQITRTRI